MEPPRQLNSIPRLAPYAGLVIDAGAWATAHDYHRRHHSLHLAALHGWGLAGGLNVRATDPPSMAVTVTAGVAVDVNGNVIVVPQSEQVAIPGSADGTAYVILEYVESLPRSGPGEESRDGVVIEDFRIRVADRPAAPPLLELARVQTTGASSITGAARELLPTSGEIDLRFRQPMGPARSPRLAIRLAQDGTGAHEVGVGHLVRSLRQQGFAVGFALDDPSNGPVRLQELLYVSGASNETASSSVLSVLREHVARGGWALVDPCGPDAAYLDSVVEAIGEAPAALAGRGGLALSSHYVFSAPPAGGRVDGSLGWIGSCALSSHDYGCAWRGAPEAQLEREHIRAALEFGANLAVAAATPLAG